MTDRDLARQIEAVRRFNRFYTQRIGVLDEGLLDSPYSLAEARVLYEMAQREAASAGALGRELGLDAGYLSRILRGFVQRGLVARRRSADDGRVALIDLTAKGRREFDRLNRDSQREIGRALAPLGAEDRRRLLASLAAVETLLGDPARRGERTIVLRGHRPGDMGWVVSRHGALYAEEYGWDISFEAMVADIAARFIRAFDPAHERAWIAELDGERVGCVFLVRQSPRVAKLRMLLVDPVARGLGLGERLVAECVAAARALGYARLTLWTNDILLAARHIYVRAGFRCVRRERHRSFGRSLVGEYWELDLQPRAGRRAR
ncbi:MAG: MarR family transcriptional regulator [Alphaproteobacteria bacterium]|nr:MarR family transcriptional regulator [Alphaproteobacteria bacterium]